MQRIAHYLHRKLYEVLPVHLQHTTDVIVIAIIIIIIIIISIIVIFNFSTALPID